jgi:hypothetical protein
VSNGTHSNVQTVVETSSYLALARKLFSESEMSEIVAMVAADPKCGDLMRKIGGFRKVRVRVANRGMSGGARVVYIYTDERLEAYCVRLLRGSRSIEAIGNRAGRQVRVP